MTKYIIFFIIVTSSMHFGRLNIMLHIAIIAMYFYVAMVIKQDASSITVFGGRKTDWESSVYLSWKLSMITLLRYALFSFGLIISLIHILIQNINRFILLERQ